MGSRTGNKWLCSALVEAAASASRMKTNYLGAQYRHLAPRRGPKRAIVAVAHSMLVAAYHMLERDEPYRDLGSGYFTRPVDPAMATRRLWHSSNASATPSPSTSPADISSRTPRVGPGRW